MTTKDKLDLNSIDVSKLKQLTKEDCKEGVRVIWVGFRERDAGIISKSTNGRLVTAGGDMVYVKWGRDGCVLTANIVDCYILEDSPSEQKYSIEEIAKILGLEITYVDNKFYAYDFYTKQKIKELEELGYTVTKK